ncbi:MAG: tRNA (cytidine(34)-2'-O)-methyltransferase [Anaerovoracaceae bacterium]
MSIHIVLVEPEIPPNTGNIARTCAATGTKLHLVEPLGFSIEDKALRRAGLDYWPLVDLEVHKSLLSFLEKYQDWPFYLATTKAKKIYTEIKYEDNAMIIFGKETAGLPVEFISKYEDRCIRIPMSDNIKLRSLNLANSANIVLFEALRQLGFPELV